MARGGKKAANGEPNPEMEEKKRLKKLAISKQMLSEKPSRVNNSLNPSKTVIKHHGKDILRKSQRKNRFLFSFPGLLAPISGGKIGELKDLGTKNPILYLDFPQGQMKLFGTIVYPKNGYLTMQFSRGGKNVVCEDYLDNMIVFSDAWWIGRKEENPEEAQLEFPKGLNVQEKLECDFKGGAGAGATCVPKRSISGSGVKHVEEQSPEHEQEELLSESQNDSKEFMELTPTRRSTRAAGKKFNLSLQIEFLKGKQGNRQTKGNPTQNVVRTCQIMMVLLRVKMTLKSYLVHLRIQRLAMKIGLLEFLYLYFNR